eukprot:TRINITY_DN3976_c4_g2_i1.p1 TRINITY_DN3976_c4_g2~~TRINITY_DN3976_c4_g2_i1.p1  ORF type:complete len:127 (+),score=21.23 TRINITY_DN3976_c4_g2_i1:3-383(+)
MCLEDEETIDHLLLRCNNVVKICNTVISWLGCSWVFPEHVQDLFMAWKSPIGTHRGKEMWKLSFLAVIWHIWEERNARCFEGVETNGESICGKIKFAVAQWVSINPIFRDYSVEQIIFNWEDVAVL